jgi:hypothetical protein
MLHCSVVTTALSTVQLLILLLAYDILVPTPALHPAGDASHIFIGLNDDKGASQHGE